MLERLGIRPLLVLDLRLGEGTGAALAIHLIDAAVRVRDEMATFGSAGVSGPAGVAAGRAAGARRPRAQALTEVIFVRHGATSWSGRRYCGRSDPPLSADGRAAVAAVAAELAPALPPGVRFVTSPARRARQTAAVLAAAAGADHIEVDERWREADFGLAEGRTFDELAAVEPALASALAGGVTEIDWPGGETAAQLATRVEAAWAELVARARPTVVVSHGGPIRHAIGFDPSMSWADVGLLDPAAAVRVRRLAGLMDR